MYWHIYPLGFCDAPVRPTEDERVVCHRLRRVIDWLDYAKDMGMDGIQLGPIFSSTSHGYDTLDYYTIDPRLGTEQDFLDLAAACKEKGLALVLDGVFNHVGEHSSYNRPGLVKDSVFEGHGSLVELDHESDEVVALVTDVMRHWLERGATGWRLDAAYAVAPEFWAKVVGNIGPCWTVGEMIHGDYVDYVQRSGLDSVTQYELWKAIWSSIKDKNFFELEWCLRRHNEFLEHFIPMTFVGNHDVTRIATQVGREGSKVAHAVLFTVGGIPSVYYGDELGWEGTKYERLGGDDEVRPGFPAIRTDEDPHFIRALCSLRHAHPWLQRARTETVEIQNEFFVYDAVDPDSDRRLRVTLTPTNAQWELIQ